MASSSSSVGSGPASSDEAFFPSVEELVFTDPFLGGVGWRVGGGAEEKGKGGGSTVYCTSCKEEWAEAVAGCSECSHLLCSGCLSAHRSMHCFDAHDPIPLFGRHLPRPCLLHAPRLSFSFCLDCRLPLCRECFPHHSSHRTLPLTDAEAPLTDSRVAVDDHVLARLDVQFHKAQMEITNTWDFYRSVLDERKKDLLIELESVYKEKRLELSGNGGVLVPRTVRDCLALGLRQGGAELRQLITALAARRDSSPDIEFVSNYPAIQTAVKNTFGYVRSGCEGRFLLSNLNTVSKLARTKMSYSTRFGDYGLLEGQFTEPSGIASDPHNNIIVADANSHRVQVFNQWGKFRLQFGECGKSEGQLLYPNRVSVGRGEIVVTERAPSHQIQVFDSDGRFIRKFGSDVLGHPRAVTVDPFGRIIVVECKVMRVLIFDDNGNVLAKFNCSRVVEFPNGVAVNDRCEIFISDNRGHCIRVFNYSGAYLRQIGAPGITNYPIGVGINQSGQLLVGDNHNNFNLTVFTQEGTLIGAYESKVKHAQCFDMTVMYDGSVAMASRDHRIYVYRFASNSVVSDIKKPLL